jgi:hypothetical protein
MRRLVGIHAGRKRITLVLSWCGSNIVLIWVNVNIITEVRAVRWRR